MKEPAIFNLAGVVGPDAPIETAANGAQQSASPFRPTLFPPYAFLAISEVVKLGAEKYEAWNWLKISTLEHMDHMLVHSFMHVLEDDSEGLIGHLLRVATRANMALHVEIAKIIQERKIKVKEVVAVSAEIIAKELHAQESMKGKIVKTCPHCQLSSSYAFAMKRYLCAGCHLAFE